MVELSEQRGRAFGRIWRVAQRGRFNPGGETSGDQCALNWIAILDSKEAHEYTLRVFRENERQRSERIARGKAAAHPAKEPIDLGVMKRLSTTDGLGRMTDAELLTKLEELYYVDHPELMTLAELAAAVEELASW